MRPGNLVCVLKLGDWLIPCRFWSMIFWLVLVVILIRGHNYTGVHLLENLSLLAQPWSPCVAWLLIRLSFSRVHFFRRILQQLIIFGCIFIFIFIIMLLYRIFTPINRHIIVWIYIIHILTIRRLKYFGWLLLITARQIASHIDWTLLLTVVLRVVLVEL